MVLSAFTVQAAPVNINRADAEEIAVSLKGIGPKKAEAIVVYRQQHGEFKTLRDLDKVKGIGAKTIQALSRDILFADAPVVVIKTPGVGPKSGRP